MVTYCAEEANISVEVTLHYKVSIKGDRKRTTGISVLAYSNLVCLFCHSSCTLSHEMFGIQCISKCYIESLFIVVQYYGTVLGYLFCFV